MTPEQELALFRKIGSFIENEFYQEFGKEVYGEIIRVCGRHAFQPNNEIRNLLAHLSGAFYTIRTGKTQAVMHTGDSIEDAEAEIERARRHLYIAKCDGLTILLLGIEEIFKARLTEAELDYDQKLIEFRRSKGAIEKARSQIPTAPADTMGLKAKIIEDNKIYQDICDRLQFLVLSANNLLCEIDEHCPSKGAFFSRYPKVRAIGSFWKHHPLSTRIFGGVVATLIVFFATRYLFPDFFDALGTKMASWLNYLRSKL
jgi:hypothetical protein